MGAPNLSPAFYAETVGHIYEAALEPQRWLDVIGALDRVYPDARITLFTHRDGRPTAGFSFSKNFPDGDKRAYADHFVSNSPFIKYLHRLPLGVQSYSEPIIGDAELYKTEYYNDFMRPRRLGHYATGIIFERNPSAMTAFSIADRKDDRDRRAHQFHTLGILLPHLKRAMQLHRVVSAERATAMAIRTVYDQWPHAAFVLDESGTMVSMNGAATRLLARESCIWLDRSGQLRTLASDEGSALAIAIRKHAQLAESRDCTTITGSPESFAIRRPAPAPPLYAMAWPLPFDGSPEFGGTSGRVLAVVFDPRQVQRTPVDWLARRYRLSPAETRLAEAIVNGVPLTQAAEQFGLRLSSARTRLKIIQTKTGCSRQVDLVRLAMSLPALMRN